MNLDKLKILVSYISPSHTVVVERCRGWHQRDSNESIILERCNHMMNNMRVEMLQSDLSIRLPDVE